MRWLDEADASMEEVLATTTSDAPEVGAAAEAEDFLRQRLQPGPIAATELIAEADTLRISERTLKRAKAQLGVRSVFDRIGGHWTWTLPPAA